jgi:NADH-quinone oxidoreductase subunit M
LQVLIGAWRAFPTMAVLAGVGILVGVAYTLRVLQQAFFCDSTEEASASPRPPSQEMDPISTPERIGAVILIGATLAIGLYPRLLLDLIEPSFNSPLFEGLRKAGGF